MKNNFITSNAYQCIEINAHSLLALVRDCKNDYFMSWLLGSQSCEKTFRSLRSMTSTFSTVVNCSLLVLPQQKHKLHIQEECQSKTGDARNIRFPRQERYGNKKDGENKYVTHSLEITNQELHDTLKRAERAQENINNLGMEKGFRDDKQNWTSPPIPTHLTVTNDESNDDDDSDGEHDCIQDSFIMSNSEIDDMVKDVNTLYVKKVVDKSLKEKVDKIKKCNSSLKFEKVDFDRFGISIYDVKKRKVNNSREVNKSREVNENREVNESSREANESREVNENCLERILQLHHC